MAEGAKRRIPKWLVITAAIVIVLAVGLNLTKGFDPSESAAPDTEADAAQPASVPDYTVARVDDVSMGTAVRFEYRVVIPGEPTEADLRAVVDAVVEEAKAEQPFNALSIGLYNSEDEIDGAYTLGVAELAPGGDWGAADTVEAGDYDAMELTVTIY